MEKLVTTTNSEYIRICDICNNPAAKKCNGCGIDLCNTHSNVIDFDIFSDNTNGDYPDYLCDNCHKLFKQYESQLKLIHEKYYNTIDELNNEWKLKCIKGVNNES